MRHELLKSVTRIVVKLGTGILTNNQKQPDDGQMEQLVAQVAGQVRAGKELVLVTSGAVGAGMGILGFEKRPIHLAELQASAAIGQSRLMAIYERLFAKFGLHVAQVLLTHEDLEDHDRHLNARNTLLALLQRGVVPIINENDAVSCTELKFGDNDRLSALVACLLPADLLVILTDIDALYTANPKLDAFILVGGWAQFGPQAYAQVTDQVMPRLKSKQLVIVAGDTLPPQIAALREGRSHVQIGQRPYEMGYRAPSVMTELIQGSKGASTGSAQANGSSVQDTIYTGLDECTAQNVDTCLATKTTSSKK